MVKINIKGLHLDVTPALDSHVNEQVGKLVENFSAVIVENIDVTLGVDSHHSHINTVSIKVPVRGNDIVIEEQGDDMYKVITSIANKASRAVRKVKEKSQNHKGKDKRAIVEVDETEE